MVTRAISGKSPSNSADCIRSLSPMSWEVSDLGKSDANLGFKTFIFTRIFPAYGGIDNNKTVIFLEKR